MSLADFATCLNLSIAFAVRLFCSGGLAWSAGAAPVVTDVGGATALVSDGAAWAAACACAGEFETGANSNSAAIAATAGDVMGAKGR
jgi:hypothetical protein